MEKVPFARGDIPILPGHHLTTGLLFPIRGETHHFKWFGNVVGEQKNRFAEYSMMKIPWAVESKRLLGYIKHHRGRVNPNSALLNTVPVINDPVGELNLSSLPEAWEL